MVDTVRNGSAILEALADNLRSDTRTASMQIQVMEELNPDPNLAVNGWVGIYMDTVAFGPRTIGMGDRNWEFTYTFRLLIQSVDYEYGRSAHQKLEGYVKDVLDVVLGDKTLQANVEILTEGSVTYRFVEEIRESMHFEAALVTLQFDGRSK
jgi:hypothetical protein